MLAMSDPYAMLKSTTTKGTNMKYVEGTFDTVHAGASPIVGQVAITRNSGKRVTVLEVITHVSKSGKITHRTRCEDMAGLEIWTSF